MAARTRFSCGDALDIRQVAALHDRLKKALLRSSTIELLADRVERADTAGLQLLVALVAETEQCGGAVSWKKPSRALIDAATLLGLERALGLAQYS